MCFIHGFFTGFLEPGVLIYCLLPLDSVILPATSQGEGKSPREQKGGSMESGERVTRVTILTRVRFLETEELSGMLSRAFV